MRAARRELAWLPHLIGLSILMLSLQVFAEGCQYSRSFLWAQPWRIFTAHLVHVHTLHLLFNLLALWGLYFLFDPPRWRWFYSAGLFAALSITLYIHIALPEYHYYRGLSGVLHGWYMGLALWAMLQQRGIDQWIGGLIASLLILKVLNEWLGYLPTARQILQVDVLYQAHGVGLLSVIVFTFLWGLGVILGKKGVKPRG